MVNQRGGRVPRHKATGEPEGQVEGWFKTAKHRLGLHRFGESARMTAFPTEATAFALWACALRIPEGARDSAWYVSLAHPFSNCLPHNPLELSAYSGSITT
ncbi:MAG: hypothetical protein KME49_19205 [Brasilonema octagenarum HA4186-MV1]|jgi:hypothetical protein|uniref:Transposase n=2 Tax=Brasilonema TaxID=383614 RepID=A0A856MDA7_9CYAN|nr:MULTISPECIES: hypothetical protein [Brasilonema]MBW4627569.1 hypothetical protein [Brasilonema octagenarum HA4186-MV1]NMF63627.1 hypothetical protein [Brasilonema octagenarum UFV-OR1]QDL08089.1 hypothetical protein DP114_09390 [Brasilonema sennae CENA114]QDL14448.1 hypothetical protein DP113_09345 [Brasilonema octagenarum UFV-E1]